MSLHELLTRYQSNFPLSVSLICIVWFSALSFFPIRAFCRDKSASWAGNSSLQRFNAHASIASAIFLPHSGQSCQFGSGNVG